MRKSNLRLLPLCLLGACANQFLDGPAEIKGAYSEHSEGVSAGVPTFAPTKQDTDYSVNGLFSEHHGDFVQNSKPFREDIRFNFHLEDSASVKNEPGNFDLYSFELEGDHEFVVDPDAFVKAGGTIGTRRYNFSSGFKGANGDENLNQISVRAGGGFFVNDDLLLSGEIEPGIFSDLDSGLNGSDFQFFVKTLATLQLSDEIYLKGGLYIDQVFNDLPVYPVAGIAWLFQPKWRFDALIPRSMTLSYTPTPPLTLNTGFALDGNQYNLNTSFAGQRAEVTVTTQEFIYFAGADYRIDEHVSAYGKIGATLFGDTEFKGITGRSDGTLDAGFFLEIGAGFTF